MKNKKIKKTPEKSNSTKNLPAILQTKIIYFKKIIEKTLIAVQKYKSLDIIGVNEINVCIESLESLYIELNKVKETIQQKKKKPYSVIYDKLQRIKDELAIIFRTFGTQDIEDLLYILYGSDFLKSEQNSNSFYSLLKRYIHPIGYKIMPWTSENNPSTKTEKLKKNRIVEDHMIVETSCNFDCFDLARTSRSFQTKVYGIKTAIHNYSNKCTIIICAIVDNLLLNCIDHPFIGKKIQSLYDDKPNSTDFMTPDFQNFVESLTLKEIFIYSNDELYQRYVGYINQTHLMKQKIISQIVKEFLNGELYSQRTTIIQLLIKKDNPEFQYLAYLLYDLLSNDNNGHPDTIEQTLLYDSLPWTIKKIFRKAMKQTIKYTKNLANYDSSNLPLEQQICLLKAPDMVKEKAMTKLKEVKAKSEDSGSKAKQYLDGLLKIPFGIYKKEPALTLMDNIRVLFATLIKLLIDNNIQLDIPIKDKYSTVEMFNYLHLLKTKYLEKIRAKYYNELIHIYCHGKRETLVVNICNINLIVKQYKLKGQKICHSGRRTAYMKLKMKEFILKHQSNLNIITSLQDFYSKKTNINIVNTVQTSLTSIVKKINAISTETEKITYTLENAVHGHKEAKRQLERIIGQWISGEQTGYCLGFEGPPGVGKTSLAKKGLANCLIDKYDKKRPFSFIAVGGSSNGSTLAGHNYTYVGSTWGRIVDILIQNKCMNPIIFIDELDKISRTEHGKEIIGILTHLTDPTQNDSFQDKYFTGIDLDLSKVLFVFSYNDPTSIDRILLDRIHRVKFSHLTCDDKLIITNKYILPEILQKMGLENTIQMNDDVIIKLIEEYTLEAGVRKLKEVLFEIISEINLEILSQKHIKEGTDIINISFEDIKYKYLKHRNEIRYTTIHKKPKIGLINGLWANSMGLGGIIPIECFWFPSSNFLELKLTGLQGDVMKESMNVAKTLAWTLTSEIKKKSIMKFFKKDTITKGIHVHCPEGATPKDGPSAGTAITVTMFSLLNDKKIKNHIAITGEINLQGQITAIGGLENKITGGLRAGITEFIYPKENAKDFKKIKEKNNNHFESITFHEVSTIEEVLEIVFI